MQHHPEEEAYYWIYNGQEDLNDVPATVRRVKIAETVIKIPNYAFQSHLELEEVMLSSSVQVIGKYAFSQCKNLKSILYQQSLDDDDDDEDDENKEEENAIIIPSNVRLIERGAFYGCNLLAKLCLKEGLMEIEQDAFASCESLTEVEIPSTVKVIDHSAFQNCTSLARLSLNEGLLERIGQGAFRECESLTEVDFPSTVKVIDHSAFQNCTSLARLGLNEGLERIETLAFKGCDSLSHVKIPQGVNSIGNNAFLKCRSLISIELPEECSFNIDLSGCRSLVSVAGQVIAFFGRVLDRAKFFQSSKLGSLVDDEADLVHRLNHRFDNSPLNKLCYYQSYHQSSEDAMAQLRSSLMEDDPLAATKEVDGFGMTPLHLLSLSQTPNLDMLLAVMDAGKPGHMVRSMDSIGCTPMDYLCLNRMPDSKHVIRRLLQTRFEQVLGLDLFWEFDMLQAIDEALAGDWSSRKREIGGVIRKFERKDILSILELFLWKVKIDEVSSEEQTVDREFCRVHSGASIVIPHVLSFFDDLDVDEDYFDSFSDQSEGTSEDTSESASAWSSIGEDDSSMDIIWTTSSNPNDSIGNRF